MWKKKSNRDNQSCSKRGNKKKTFELDSNVKLTDKATWSPTTPFQLDISYLDINSPESLYTQDEQNLITELGSTELDFSYLSIKSPKLQISDENYNKKSGLKQENSDHKHVHSQAKFQIDVPDIALHNVNKCRRFYEEWVSPFSRRRYEFKHNFGQFNLHF